MDNWPNLLLLLFVYTKHTPTAAQEDVMALRKQSKPDTWYSFEEGHLYRHLESFFGKQAKKVAPGPALIPVVECCWPCGLPGALKAACSHMGGPIRLHINALPLFTSCLLMLQSCVSDRGLHRLDLEKGCT